MTARDNDSNTALGLAALYGNLAVCKFFVSRGSDLNEKNAYERTALDLYGDHMPEDLLDKQTAKEHRNELLAAFLEIKDQKNASQAKVIASQAAMIESQAAKIAVLERPALATASMLFSDKFSDVVFVCGGGERIPAHRFIVAACSESLDALLSNPQWLETADDRDRVAEVPMEQSAAAVCAMLRFVYTGEVGVASAGLSCADWFGVLDLSSQHLLPELKAECERRLVESLSLTTVSNSLIAAHLLDLSALHAASVDFVRANMAALLLSSSSFSLNSRLSHKHPAVWKKLRAALGLEDEVLGAEEEEEEEEGGEEEEEEEGWAGGGNNQKRSQGQRRKLGSWVVGRGSWVVGRGSRVERVCVASWVVSCRGVWGRFCFSLLC